MTEHLGYDKGGPSRGRGGGNSRNGTTSKTLRTELGDVPVEVPRDRDGSFEPQLVKKRQTRFAGFDAKILALYARGMTVRDIQGHLEAFEAKWGRRYETISSSWRTNWDRVVPFLDFPPEVRKVIYTTNAIESLNATLRKLLHYRGHFPNDEALTKLLYLALTTIEKKGSGR
jgi:transposase-like protein